MIHKNTWTRSAGCETSACVEVMWAAACESDQCVDVGFSASCDSSACVEVGHDGDRWLIRDSKLGADSPVLSFTPEEWEAHLVGVKDGRFDPEPAK